MRKLSLGTSVFLGAALALLAMEARAHQLSCKLTLASLDERGGVIGKPGTVLLLDHYPAGVELNFTVINDIPTKGSTAQAVLLWDLPFCSTLPRPSRFLRAAR